MIRSILDGRKSQTRRVVRGKVLEWLVSDGFTPGYVALPENDLSPYGYAGDRLWVRETYFAYGRWETRYSSKKGRDEWHFIDMTIECDRAYQYAADNPDVPLANARGGVLPGWWKRPAIFMPQAAARITLEITDVRVERLQSITADDARAEWLEFREDYIAGRLCRRWRAYGSADGWFPEGRDIAPIHSFQTLWDSLNAARGYGWSVNPFVWVVEFRRVEA
jgi:hypothetical protein